MAVGFVLPQHGGAHDVGGHQVGGELYAGEVQVDRLGDGANQQRLAQAGHPFEEAVAAGEQARQHAGDDLVLSDDDLAHLLGEGSEVTLEGFDFLMGVRNGGGHEDCFARGYSPGHSRGWMSW